MTAITIQGEKFEVPDAVIAKYDHFLTPEAPDGLRHTVHQTLCENLRNNFAKKVSDVLGQAEQLTDEQRGTLQNDFNTYAQNYEFGIRQVGSGAPKLDPVEREMYRLARGDLTDRYKKVHNEKAPKEWLDEMVPQYVEAAHEDLIKRARAIMRQKQGNSSPVLDQLFTQAAA